MKRIPLLLICLALLTHGCKSLKGLPPGDMQPKCINIVYGTDRQRITGKRVLYGERRRNSEGYETGVVKVYIPKAHREGIVDKPDWWNIFADEKDSIKYFVMGEIVNSQALADTTAKKLMNRSRGKSTAFVFVHGYNNTFEDAAKRAAQLAFDLGFDGCPMMFSWPSNGSALDYVSDLENATWSAPHLKAFLTHVVETNKPNKLHLIAHSMGNQVLTKALISISEEHPNIKFNQIILAAPDIDAEIFKRDVAPKISGSGERVTMYSSSEDKALKVSKSIRSGYKRAGETDKDIVCIKGIETIDASKLAGSGYFNFDLNHSYFADQIKIIFDMSSLFSNNYPPEQRLLEKIRSPYGVYWAFPK